MKHIDKLLTTCCTPPCPKGCGNRDGAEIKYLN